MNSKQLFTSPSITLTGKVEASLVVELDKQIKALMDKNVLSAVVLLTTEGGSVLYGRSIYERLRLLQEIITLDVIGVGGIFSVGVPILMVFPRDRRWMTTNSMAMFYQTQTSISSHAVATSIPVDAKKILHAEDLVNIAQLKKVFEWSVDKIAKGTGQKKSLIRKMISTGTYFTAKEAFEFGLVGGIIEGR